MVVTPAVGGNNGADNGGGATTGYLEAVDVSADGVVLCDPAD